MTKVDFMYTNANDNQNTIKHVEKYDAYTFDK